MTDQEKVQPTGGCVGGGHGGDNPDHEFFGYHQTL